VSDGFTVVRSEVLDASGVFERQSRVLSDVAPGDGPHAADGGDGVINAALSGALRAATLTTGQFAAVVGEQGQKLRAAHDRYEQTEQANTALAQRAGS
jgi:Family of unknown function (DUF6317)